MTPHQAIDIHTHILPPGWEDYAARYGVQGFPSLRLDDACNATILLGAKEFRRVTDQCFAPLKRIEDMDRESVGRQLLSPVPITLCYWAPAEATAAFASMQNEYIASVVAKHPQRFLGAGTIPMQSAKLAIAELERVRKLGLHAVEIGSHVNGKDFDHPELFDIFAAAADMGMAIFVHPQGPSIGQERMGQYYLPFMVGYAADNALAITRLILGGVLERLPKLRMAFAHGGGAFPAALGRIDHGWKVRSEAKQFIARPPSEYARRLYFDTLCHDRDYLRINIERFGSDHVMIGSDYPFDMGVEHPLAQLDGLDLAGVDLENVLYRTAERFLGVST